VGGLIGGRLQLERRKCWLANVNGLLVCCLFQAQRVTLTNYAEICTMDDLEDLIGFLDHSKPQVHTCMFNTSRYISKTIRQF